MRPWLAKQKITSFHKQASVQLTPENHVYIHPLVASEFPYKRDQGGVVTQCEVRARVFVIGLHGRLRKHQISIAKQEEFTGTGSLGRSSVTTPQADLCHYNCVLQHQCFSNINMLQNHPKKVLVTQSCPTLCAPMDCGLPGSSSMGCSRQEYQRGLPFLSPGDLPNPGTEARSPALQVDSLPSEPAGKPRIAPKACYLSGLRALPSKFLIQQIWVETKNLHSNRFQGQLVRGLCFDLYSMAQQVKNLPAKQETQETWL